MSLVHRYVQWQIELPLTEQQVERRLRLHHEVTGALTTLIETKKTVSTVRPIKPPWWWTGDEDAAESSTQAIDLFRSGG